jgi:hypothetical protein
MNCEMQAFSIEDNYAVNVVDEPRVSAVSLHLEIPVEHMLCVGLGLVKKNIC